MKTLFLTLITMVSFSSFKAAAQDINVSASVVNAFQSSFKQASEVHWKEAGNYMKADFNMNGQYVSAFYDQNATLIAVTKNISPVQLPVTLQTSLKASYEDYWISEVFELSDQNGISYYTTVENGDSKITLKSIGSSWSTYKKSRKS
jgi:post-segregation antitoxin (ccd killing protein)